MNTKTCERTGCKVKFAASPETKRFCSTTCRTRANRDARGAKESVAADATAGKAEHELVVAVRTELTACNQLDTVNGQLALQMARRLTNPSDPAISALSKELRSLMDECKAAGGTPPPAPPTADGPAAPPAPKLTPLEEMRAKREAEEQARVDEG